MCYSDGDVKLNECTQDHIYIIWIVFTLWETWLSCKISLLNRTESIWIYFCCSWALPVAYSCRTKRPLLAPVQALLNCRNEKHLQYMQTHMEPHTLILQYKFSGGYANWKSIMYSHHKHISFVVVVFFFFLTITKQTILRTSSKSNARLWHLWWTVFPQAAKFFSCEYGHQNFTNYLRSWIDRAINIFCDQRLWAVKAINFDITQLIDHV